MFYYNTCKKLFFPIIKQGLLKQKNRELRRSSLEKVLDVLTSPLRLRLVYGRPFSEELLCNGRSFPSPIINPRSGLYGFQWIILAWRSSRRLYHWRFLVIQLPVKVAPKFSAKRTEHHKGVSKSAWGWVLNRCLSPQSHYAFQETLLCTYSNSTQMAVNISIQAKASK